ncbi:uncharacterized protein LOC135396688 [Ornithodoros turicata]|uniref:uncharacterized protein LOC135396688 n=1 Tax=Ornithodoros turicata TaxID=34597 RepID=UPI0031393C6F
MREIKEATVQQRPAAAPVPPSALKLIPVSGEDELQAVEESLIDEATFDAFVNHLWTCGGASVAECTRNVLRRLMTMDVAGRTCYSGKNAEKRVFKTLRLALLLHASVRKVFPSARDPEIAAAARNYFRFVPALLRKKQRGDQSESAL